MPSLPLFESVTHLERARALDVVAAPLRRLFGSALPRGRFRDLLHGTWLGHPLHPVAVQVPTGAWLSAGVLDLLPGTGPAAGALIGTGLAAAGPAVLSGYADWLELHPQQQRVGVVHSLANATAAGLYAASLVARARGRSGRGKALSFAGLGAVGLGGFLGGHLAYRQASGANHVEDVPHLVEPGWHDLGRLDAIPEGKPVQLEVSGQPLLVLREGSTVHALAGRCSHLSGPLADGEVTDGCVVCPWHGSTFRLGDGAVVHGPATSPLPVFEVRQLREHVEVRLPGAG